MNSPQQELQISRYINLPDLKNPIIGDSIVPVVGNANVYPMSGDYDRAVPTYNKKQRLVYSSPIGGGDYGLPSGSNPAYTYTSSILRQSGYLRPLKCEIGPYPGYIFGEYNVDPRLVQNAGQYTKPVPVGDDICQYRTSLNSGGNIIQFGTRGGISSRNLQRNIVNYQN